MHDILSCVSEKKRRTNKDFMMKGKGLFMKNSRKLMSILLIAAMLFTLAAPAMAADTAHTITITNETAGHTYTAYQVFSGDIETLEGKKVLTNIAWGTGVDDEALLTALKTRDAYKDCETAEDVADVIKDFGDNSAALDAFAKIVGEYLATDADKSDTPSKDGTVYNYVINVTGDGYYFIKDEGDFAETNDAATKYILQVVKDVNVAAKDDVPTIDKVIINADSNNGDEGKGTAQDVGSVVDFKLTSKVPTMDGYESYTYVVHDTMSDGLSFNNDVVVTINGTELTKDTDFTVSPNGQSFTITFNNFINQKANAGKDIVITYSATINEKALNTSVEINTVYLEYSNDPNSNTTGKTPDHIVYVYDFDIVIDKYTGEVDGGERLSGAEFVLYKLNGENKEYYSHDEADKKVEWTTEENAEKVLTDGNGAARFAGLDSGTYYLKETKAPDGYNLLKEPVEVVITATYNADGTIATSTATIVDNQYQQTQSIVNNTGAELPSTGGIGTTIFYVLGGALVIGAGVLLVTKRRMGAE
ncbi:MAG: isopeptide-forming domain-containing fimbrial protein [Peptococcaceae bacterium]|nr:isopeptide-forming domain-containing fimbrial protein [Peptococcaceae bacterium]